VTAGSTSGDLAGGGGRNRSGDATASAPRTFHLGVEDLTPARLAKLVDDPDARLVLDAGVVSRLDAGAEALEAAMARAAEGGLPIYGATTGFGGNAGADPVKNRAAEVDAVGSPEGATGSPWPELRDHQLRLARYLDAGSGPPLPWRVARGVVVARAHVLAQGASGVRSEVVEALVGLFRAGIAPVLPRDGSLGASGDLVSLAPLARLLAGEPVPALVKSEKGPSEIPGPDALRRAGLAPLELRGRDTLALVNGLSGVTALASLLLVEARHLHAWGRVGAAATGWALGVRQEAWSARVNEAPLRRHEGQARVAAALRAVVVGASPVPPPAEGPIQDPYSLRCIPQILGPGEEFLEVAEAWLALELDAVSDNPVPVLEPTTGKPASGDLFTEDVQRYLSGGNFFGGYVAGAAEAVAGVLARLGDLLERQGFLLVGGRRGLPENLVPPGVPAFRHGLKGVHQASSALAMGLQRGAIPATPFARSAEGHNQDVVSNAMQAATGLADQVDRAAALVAAHSTMAAQAVELRREAGSDPGPVLSAWLRQIRAHVPKVEDDTALREPMAALALDLRARTPP
jgi:histidine ammonia-lyase